MKKSTIFCLLIVGSLLNIFATKLFYQHAGSLIPLHEQVSECLSSFAIYPLWSSTKEHRSNTRKTIYTKKDSQAIEVLLDKEITDIAINGKQIVLSGLSIN